MSLREIAPRYQLNSWLSDTPAAVIDAVSGVFVMPVAYSSAAGTTSRVDDPGHYRFGRRRLDGSHVSLTFEHAGSRFALRYHKPSPNQLRAELRALELGEWGLRVWIHLLVGVLPSLASGRHGARVTAGADGLVIAEAAERAVAVLPERAPVYVTLHDSVDAFEADIAAHGYYADDDAVRSEDGPGTAPVAALRFNLEATPVVRFTLALGADSARAVDRARATIREAAAPAAVPDEPTNDVDEALDAIQTVMGWNSVLDLPNRRWYTAPTRAWIQRKFGGWFTWLDDTFFHALLAATQDTDAARRNLEVAFSSATPEGNLACLLSPRTRWLDRSQSPVGAYVLLSYALRSGDTGALARFLPVLLDAFAWWQRERRDDRTGLYAYGTSRYGHGAFQGTALAARDESFMDNSPLHDGVELDPESRRLRQLDVGLSSLLALEAELLADIAERVGELDTAAAMRAEAARIKTAIDAHLWDDDAGVYANIDLDGVPSTRIGPTSFYPLLAGVPSAERARRLVDGQLRNERAFWGRWVVPTIRRDDPAFTDNVYWRGRIWPPTNYLVYLGLRRYGFDADAHQVAERSFAMFASEWREHGHCHENYNGASGEGHDVRDSDTFYGWGALLPLMRVEEAVFPSPWEGLVIATDRGPTVEGCLWQGQRLRLEARDGGPGWRLTLAGRTVLSGDATCRLSGLDVGPGRLETTVASAAGVTLTVTEASPQRLLHAVLPDDAELTHDTEGARIALGPGRHQLRLTLATDAADTDDRG